MRVCIDIDGVLCPLRQEGQSYADLSVVPGAREALRRLRAGGHTIILYTARHMKTCSANVGLVVARQGLTTLDWLERHDLPYDEIHFGKPWAQLYVDDNGWRFEGWEAFDRALEGLGLKESPPAESPDRAEPPEPVVVLAMAGRGRRFSAAGGSTVSASVPKPLIDVAGRPMLWWSLRSLAGLRPRRLVFVVRAEDERRAGIVSQTRDLCSDLESEGVLRTGELCFVEEEQPSGQLTSVLAAAEHVDPDAGLLVAGCDTWVVSPLARQLRDLPASARGLIPVADLPGDRWSFAEAGPAGVIRRVAEKERISSHACVGLYYFTSGDDFLRQARRFVKAGRRLKGEYYVAPLYQQMIDKGAEIRIGPVEAVHEMGTPASHAEFLGRLRRGFVDSAGRTRPAKDLNAVGCAL